MLMRQDAALQVLTKLTPDDFYSTIHKTIWRSANEVWKRGQHPDVLLIKSDLEARKNHDGTQTLLEWIGGVAYLMVLAESVPSANNVDTYISLLKEVTVRAKAWKICTETLNEINILDPSDIVARFPSTAENADGGAVNAGEIMTSEEWDNDSARYVATGYEALDSRIRGFREGNVTIVGARPGNGKTSMLCCFARNAIINGHKVFFATYEMMRRDILKRMQTGWGLNDEKFYDYINNNLYIFDPFTIGSDESVERLLGEVAACKNKFGTSLVLVDYLQIVDTRKRTENPYHRISEVSKGLRKLARITSLPVVAAAQLNRHLERRDNKKPNLSDLRESGKIEEDAATIMLLHRPYLYDNTEPEGLMEIGIAKARFDKAFDTVAMTFDGSKQRFL